MCERVRRTSREDARERENDDDDDDDDGDVEERPSKHESTYEDEDR